MMDTPRAFDDPVQTPQQGVVDARNADYSNSIGQWFQQYLGRPATPEEINGWLTGGTPISQVEAGIRNSPEAQAYAAKQTPSGPGRGPQPTNGGGNTGGINNPWAPPPNVGGLMQPFGTTFAPPAAQPYPDAPKFTPPSMEDAANDPGYMFGLNQGKRNLESWLSAHGQFNDSTAAEALQDYGRNAATTGYNNVWGRRFQEYEGALQPWQTQYADVSHRNDMAWQEAFNTWLQDWNVFTDQRNSTFDKNFKWATA